MSKATERRSSRSPWLVAEMAKRNSSKSIEPSLLASKVSKANLTMRAQDILRCDLTCRSYQPCPEDRIACRLRRTSSCPIDHWGNREGIPRENTSSYMTTSHFELTACHWRISRTKEMIDVDSYSKAITLLRVFGIRSKHGNV